MMVKWKQHKLMDLKYITKQEIKITSKVQIRVFSNQNALKEALILKVQYSLVRQYFVTFLFELRFEIKQKLNCQVKIYIKCIALPRVNS